MSRIPNAAGDGISDDTGAVAAWLSAFPAWSIADFGGWDCVYYVRGEAPALFDLPYPLRIQNARLRIGDCAPDTDIFRVAARSTKHMDGWAFENVWILTAEADAECWRHSFNIEDLFGYGYRNFRMADVMVYPSARQTGSLVKTTYHSGDVGVIYESTLERVKGWAALDLLNVGDSVTLMQPAIASRNATSTNRSLAVSTVPGGGEFHVHDPNFQANGGVLVGNTIGFHLSGGVSEAECPLTNPTNSLIELLGNVDTAWINDHQFQGGSSIPNGTPKAAFVDYGCRNVTIRTPRLGPGIDPNPFTIADAAASTTKMIK